MKLGLRVVRGPDWKWKNEDDGEGHVGTLIKYEESNRFSENTVTVQWDSGHCDSYRAGSQGAYDLRTVDNAPSGVKHENTWCNSCTQYISGIKWTCKQCQDFDLCSPCYMADKHDLKHPFFRYETADSLGVEIPRREGAAKIQMKGIFASAKVLRGSDWEYCGEDGIECRKGKTGIVTAIIDWNKNARSAACVKWPSGVQNAYRVGYEGKMDLIYKEDAANGCYYRDHLPVLGDETRTCAATDYEADSAKKEDKNEKDDKTEDESEDDTTTRKDTKHHKRNGPKPNEKEDNNKTTRKEAKHVKSNGPKPNEKEDNNKAKRKEAKHVKNHEFTPKYSEDDKTRRKESKNGESHEFTPKYAEDDKTRRKEAENGESNRFATEDADEDKAEKKMTKISKSNGSTPEDTDDDESTEEDTDDDESTEKKAKNAKSDEFPPKYVEDDETRKRKAENGESSEFTPKETEGDKHRKKEGKSGKSNEFLPKEAKDDEETMGKEATYSKSLDVSMEETEDDKITKTETKMDESLALLSENLKTLLIGDQFCDLTVKVADREFRIHKAILGARSPVFACMLTLDMMEKSTGVVDIFDCDPDAFEDFLFYLYSGKAERISHKNVADLYQVADKYDVQGLREECVHFMKRNLSEDFFCDVIAVALMHDDKNLINFAVEYFLSNAGKILLTVKWQMFMKENPVYANELYIKAFRQNF